MTIFFSNYQDIIANMKLNATALHRRDSIVQRRRFLTVQVNFKLKPIEINGWDGL